MPSLMHEALLLLFRNRPSLAAELMQQALGQKVPAHDTAEVQEATLSQIVPTEYHADLVVLLRADRPVFGIVVEVQLKRDEDKRYSWPLYAAALRAKLRCPACVLVVCAEQAVARWANRIIDTGQPGAPFVPLVIGPQAVPKITEAEQARRAPELAVLSTQAHGHESDAAQIALAALQGAAGLESERAVLYYDLIAHAVSDAARRQLEELMQSGSYEFQSTFAKHYLEKGRAEGRTEGRAEGRTEGRVEGCVRALLRILASRGFALDPRQEQTVRGCTDTAVLDRWIDRALTAKSVDEVLRDA